MSTNYYDQTSNSLYDSRLRALRRLRMEYITNLASTTMIAADFVPTPTSGNKNEVQEFTDNFKSFHGRSPTGRELFWMM